MLDPAKSTPLDLNDFSSYIRSCLDLANHWLSAYATPMEVGKSEDELNKYPRLEKLGEPRDIKVLEDLAAPADIERVKTSLLNGGIFWEHTCAGEATRLGLGTKYLLNPALDFSPEVMGRILGEDYELPIELDSLRSMTLGRRHMLQLAWDISRMAEEAGTDPAKALAKQSLLIIINEASYQAVLEDFLEANFYGFDRLKVFFMVQKSFYGINRNGGDWFYDTDSPNRLHNHGQMLMQTAMDKQVFRMDESHRPDPLTWPEYRMVLGEFDDKVSFNIEDLDYLENSLDLVGLTAAQKLSESGYRMVMEVVSNNPDNPQKGGMCAWDPDLQRNVMIESFQLAGLPDAQITFLNRNINHYPYPAQSLTAARDYGLPMPVTVKEGFVYFQPIQGDVNFLVKTAFVRRAQFQAIKAWKSGPDTPAALQAMAAQEQRSGFMDWAAELTGLDL
jgi:hypothetical protein